MTRKKWIWSLLIVGTLAATSLFLFALPSYQYESSDRGWEDSEIAWKGRTLEVIEMMFEEYRESEGKEDVYLCITSKPNWLAWSQWWENLTHPRWDLPYMEPSSEQELKALRMQESKEFQEMIRDSIGALESEAKESE